MSSSIFPATSASGITAISNAQKAEEVARTVYVGNVNSQVNINILDPKLILTCNSQTDFYRAVNKFLCKMRTNYILPNGRR